MAEIDNSSANFDPNSLNPTLEQYELPNPKIWMQDWTEELCILVIGAIALVSIFMLKTDSVPIVTGLGGGLVGYLTRGIKQKLQGG